MSGHLQNALLFALEGGKRDWTGCHRDAKFLRRTMEGAGTKDWRLIYRLLRASWDKPRLRGVRAAYEAKYKTSLGQNIAHETSGDFRQVLLDLCA